MAKLNREDLLRQGEHLLKEWLGEGSASIDQLRDVGGRDAAADVAIAARLGAMAEANSADVLRAIESASRDKNVHKEVRRALYRLEQKGVAIPAAAPTPPPAPLTQALEGYLSPLDGHGDRLVWLVKTRPSGVVHLYAVVNDPEGLREVELFDTTRKAVRAARQSLLERNEIAMIEADWRYCDFLIDRAIAWARERQTHTIGDYGRLRTVLIGTPVQTTAAPIYAHLAADHIRQHGELLVESASILEEKEMRTWFFERDKLADYLDDVKRIQHSPIVLPEIQQQERARQVGEKAVEQLFGGAMQASWVRRLEEMAYFFHATKRPEVAKRSLAVALALKDSKDGGKGIPFCEALINTGLMFWQRLDQQHEAEEQRGQLVVTPEQALREPQRRS